MRTMLRRALPALALFALVPAAAITGATVSPARAQPAGTQPAGTQPAGTQPAGQQPAREEPPREEPEEIIITATRVPKPITAIPNTVRVLDRETLNTQLAVSSSLIDGISQAVPSFSPSRQKLSGFGETFRGRSPLYLIDGVPQSNPLRDGSRDGFTIDPIAIERVEVVYGANAIQGMGATGGIINFVTRSAPRGGDWVGIVQTAVTADDGFNGDGWSHKIGAFAGRQWDTVDLALAASRESRGLFYDAEGRPVGVDTTQGDLMDSDSLNLFAKAGWTIAEGQRLQIMANAFELEGNGDYVRVTGSRAANRPTSSTEGDYPGEAPTNKVRTGSLDYSNDDLLGGRFSAQAFLQDFEAIYGGGVFADFQDPAIDPTGTFFDQSANNSEKYGLKTLWVRNGLLPGLEVAVGLDHLRDKTFQALIQSDRLWVPETVFTSTTPFLQLEQTFLDDRLRLSGGVRHEVAELEVDTYRTIFGYGAAQVLGGKPEFEETLVNLGGVLTLIDGVQAYGSYAEGFTMPDVGRVLRAVTVGGRNVEDILNLAPVVADNLEAGIDLRRGPITAAAAWFISKSDFGQVLVLNPDGIFNVSRQKTEIEGIELSARWDMTDTVAVGAGYALLEGRMDTNNDGTLDSDLDGANISPDRLNLYLEAAPMANLTTRVQLAHLFDRRFDGGDPRNDFEGFSLIDLYAAYTLPALAGMEEGVLVELGVQNLLDRQYTTYYSQTNRPTDNNAFFAGRGRTWTVNLTARF